MTCPSKEVFPSLALFIDNIDKLPLLSSLAINNSFYGVNPLLTLTQVGEYGRNHLFVQ